MTRAEFKALGPGDIVEHASGGQPLLVVANYGERVTAVRTADMTNPEEWALLRKVMTNHPKRGQNADDS